MKSGVVFLLIFQCFWAKPIVRWLHGLGDTCDRVNQYFPDMDIKCINTGAGYLTPFHSEYHTACSQLEKEAELLRSGFVMMGFSQGGLLARAILQKCSVGKYITRLITFGGPHQGVSLIPYTPESSIWDKSILRLCFYKFFQNIVGPCGYIRSTRYYQAYQESSNFLADLNNEFTFNQEYVDRVQNLEVMMTVQFMQDQIVQPHNSAVFGYYRDKSYQDLVEMEDLDIFQKDRLGLQKVKAEGKLFRCNIDAPHMTISAEEMVGMAASVANTENCLDDLKQIEFIQNQCDFD